MSNPTPSQTMAIQCFILHFKKVVITLQIKLENYSKEIFDSPSNLDNVQNNTILIIGKY